MRILTVCYRSARWPKSWKPWVFCRFSAAASCTWPGSQPGRRQAKKQPDNEPRARRRPGLISQSSVLPLFPQHGAEIEIHLSSKQITSAGGYRFGRPCFLLVSLLLLLVMPPSCLAALWIFRMRSQVGPAYDYLRILCVCEEELYCLDERRIYLVRCE
jgi:hypothetical protein